MSFALSLLAAGALGAEANRPEQGPAPSQGATRAGYATACPSVDAPGGRLPKPRLVTWNDRTEFERQARWRAGAQRRDPASLARTTDATVLPVTASDGRVALNENTFPGATWDGATPASQGIDSAKLAAAVEYLQQNSGRDGVRELLIVRNGRIIWKGDHVDNVHGVWSCTKSFTSTALGLLIDDAKCALDTLACEHVPELAGAYPDVTLRHFATMTSGYRAIGDEPQGGYTHGPSSTPFRPSPEPLFLPPGAKYAYWDSAMNMFGLVLTRIGGESIEQLFKRRIADPIGMNPKSWDWGDYTTVDGIVVNGGSGNGNKHIFISAGELARLGLLFLNQGNWNGRQLISRQWVEAATTVQVPASLPWGHPESAIDGRGVYGFNWWRNGTKPDGHPLWPGAPEGTFAATGHNNNRLFVVPEWNMVIVRLGLDQQDVRIADKVWGKFLELIGESTHRPSP